MKRIRVGVIGLGFIGKLQLDALRRIPEVEIFAISSTDPDKLEALGQAYSVKKRYASWKDLVLDPDVEAVHNCTSLSLHQEINVFCIEHDKHLYSEKPLAYSARQVEELLGLLPRHPVATCVGHQYRSNAAVHAMKELFESGAAGQLLFVRGRYLQESLAERTDYSKRLVSEDSKSRTLSDLGSHLADLMFFLTGAHGKSVCASMVTHYPVRLDGTKEIPIQSDDTTMAQFVLDNAVYGTFLVSKTAVGHKNDLSVSLECSKAELTWNQEEPDRFWVSGRASGKREVIMDRKYCSASVKSLLTLPAGHTMGWSDALRNNIQLFHRSILDGSWRKPVPYTTFRDELAVMRFLDAVVLSSQERRWVDEREMV